MAMTFLIGTGEPSPISFSMKEEAMEGEAVSASCSVSHSCPTSPPVFTWSHSGGEHFQQQRLDNGQWKATSALTFHPTGAAHHKVLQCTVTYKGGQHHHTSQVLKIKYAPVNVMVGHRSDIKEGDAVKLNCSSDANPPASSYEWHSESGARLHQGNVYMLPNVSRHTGALYCTAINTIGRGKSSPAQLNVLYAPEIKTVSSCSLETDMVMCMCIAESKPPSMVYFVLSDSVLPSTKVEKHGFVTIGTLQADLGSSKLVYCLANNTQGNSTLRFILPVNNKMQNLYIVIAIGAVLILMIVLFVVGVVKKRGRSRDSATSQMSTMTANKDVVLPQYAATKRNEKTYDDAHCPSIYGNDHIYGNMETDWDDAIYANM
ncbi:myelin-associated glycoprotein isoform X2 [Pempheris klunzingeri]|uniref:myelin-associated glycoprotein isoform X2 n=1 Tax=Pempheris klunzingeri TaxID=3127111 RepID=UPI00397EBE5A